MAYARTNWTILFWDSDNTVISTGGGTGLVFGSQTIKFIAHTFYKKNVLVQLVKARVYYVQ